MSTTTAPSDLFHTGDVHSGHVAFSARVYLVGNREYIALAVVAPQFAALPDVAEFIQSVKFRPSIAH